jgi:hypothetical protein
MGLSRYWCRPDWMICTVMADSSSAGSPVRHSGQQSALRG